VGSSAGGGMPLRFRRAARADLNSLERGARSGCALGTALPWGSRLAGVGYALGGPCILYVPGQRPGRWLPGTPAGGIVVHMTPFAVGGSAGMRGRAAWCGLAARRQPGLPGARCSGPPGCGAGSPPSGPVPRLRAGGEVAG